MWHNLSGNIQRNNKNFNGFDRWIPLPKGDHNTFMPAYAADLAGAIPCSQLLPRVSYSIQRWRDYNRTFTSAFFTRCGVVWVIMDWWASSGKAMAKQPGR